MPAYYNHPETVDDITNHIVTRVLDQFGLDYHKARRWNGLRTAEQFAQEIE
ncbi:putative phenolic acid decarboxylase subunit B [Klebsiella pneumoniae UHKPC48]|nr:putative phenolic acid decarboxylase subunit B [Klebsiella pneumoniae UHKPC48]MDR6363297.1 3-polyprenyl-4-hydroxybenzoate decarboxylase [Klebsiella sp. SORGH_AS_1173]